MSRFVTLLAVVLASYLGYAAPPAKAQPAAGLVKPVVPPPRHSAARTPSAPAGATHTARPAAVGAPLPVVAPPVIGGGNWTNVALAPSSGLCNPFLMHDATVLVHQCGQANWYKLTPASNGDYATGTWTTVAPMPSNYWPEYQAAAVLPDGRLMLQGGEYNGSCPTPSNPVWTNLGAIYDPVANTWTPVNPPAAWGVDITGCGGTTSGIGDAASTLLADGRFLLAACCAYPSSNAILNPTTLTYTLVPGPNANGFYFGHPYQDEQGYSLLPNGNILTLNIWDVVAGATTTTGQVYNPGTNTWSAVAAAPVLLPAPVHNPANATCDTSEIGPMILRPDGTLAAFGGNTGCNAGAADLNPTAIYNTSNNTWTAGPTMPTICGSGGATACNSGDAPAAVLPNGNVLFGANAGYFAAPATFFELTTTNSLIQLANQPQFASSNPAGGYNFLLLPSGQVFVTDFSNRPQLYNPTGSPLASAAPTITSVPTTLAPGSTYTLSGAQLAGLTQGVSYGDDAQGATNYPMVRITSGASVFYAGTSNLSTFSVAPATAGSVSFKIPASVPLGAATIAVVTNGIASAATNVTIQVGQTLTVSNAGTGGGTVTSLPAGINCGATCSASFATATVVTLTALPSAGSTFAGWSGGGCSGTGTCVVTMNAAQNVPATFNSSSQTLTVSKAGAGGGTVTSSPAGISCGATCNASFANGISVTLTAGPSVGSTFAGWSGGGCSGTGACTVSMTAAIAVTATFTLQAQTLSVALAGTGSGTVTSSPAGINCPGSCSASFAGGTVVTLSPTAAAGSFFSGWSGACSGNGSCAVTMNAAQSVTATFTPGSNRTWVSRFGADTGVCPRSAPCLTFQFAHDHTIPSGALDCVDSGDFGPVTITRSITIKCTSVMASIAAASGAGITIAAGAVDKIVIDGLDIEGLSTGSVGILVGVSSKVHVLNTTVRNFASQGIALNASNTHVFIDNSFVIGNPTGVFVSGTNNIASLTSSSVRASPTASLNAATASAIIGAQSSVINDSPVGIARAPGAQVISVGPSNLVTGAGSFTLTLPFE